MQEDGYISSAPLVFFKTNSLVLKRGRTEFLLAVREEVIRKVLYPYDLYNPPKEVSLQPTTLLNNKC